MNVFLVLLLIGSLLLSGCAVPFVDNKIYTIGAECEWTDRGYDFSAICYRTDGELPYWTASTIWHKSPRHACQDCFNLVKT